MVLSEKVNTFSQKNFLEVFDLSQFVSFFLFNQNFEFSARALRPFLTKIDQIVLADKYKAGSFFSKLLRRRKKDFSCSQIIVILVFFGCSFLTTDFFLIST